jgi:collagenase-like PrtC family protease
MLADPENPGRSVLLEQDRRGSYLLNSRDLCMIEHLPDLAGAGVNSLKIEGRVKSSFYVATVVKAYREALDAYLGDPAGWSCCPKWLSDLNKTSTGRSTPAFFTPGRRKTPSFRQAGSTAAKRLSSASSKLSCPTAACCWSNSATKFKPAICWSLSSPGDAM